MRVIKRVRYIEPANIRPGDVITVGFGANGIWRSFRSRVVSVGEDRDGATVVYGGYIPAVLLRFQGSRIIVPNPNATVILNDPEAIEDTPLF
jgi:hypothetical protein